MTNKKSIFKSVAVVTAFSVATRLFAFLFKVFVSRQFGASVVGVYQMALSFYFFASAVALSGLPTVISRKIAEDEKTGGENVPSLISTALVLSLSSVLPILSVIYPVAFLLPSVFADERVLPLVVIMLPALLSTSIYNVIRSWFWGKRSFLAFSFTEMLEEVLRITFTLIFSLGLIAAVTPLKGLAVGFLVSDIACAVVLFILFLIKKGKFGRIKDIPAVLKPSLPITAMRVFGGVIGAFTAIVIPVLLIKYGMEKSDASATFGRVTGMAMPLLMAPTTLTGALSVVLIPEIATIKHDDKSAMSARIDGSINFAIIIAALFTILYIPLGKEITTFVFKDEFSGVYLSNVALMLYPLGLNQISTSILNSMGLEKKSFFNYAVGAAILMILTLALPKYVGIYAVAIGGAAGSVISSFLNLNALNKKARILDNPKKTALAILLSFPLVALTCLLKNLLFFKIPPFFAIAISGGIPMILYLAACVAFRIFDVTRFYKTTRKKSLKKRDKSKK